MSDDNQTVVQDEHSTEGQHSGNQEDSSANTPKTITITEKELSDRLAKAGNDRINQISKQFQDKIDDLTGRLEAKEDADELAKIPQEDTKGRSDFQVKQSLRKQIKSLETERDTAIAKAKDDEEDALSWRNHKQKQDSLAVMKRIADKYENIDPEDLVGKTEEQAKEFCKKYGKPKESQQEEQHQPDSGIGSGGKLSDKSFIEGIGSGKIQLTKENMERAKNLGLIK